MDVGNTNHWSPGAVVPAREIMERIHAELPLEPVGPAYRGEVASRYRYRDGRGEIGLIGSVTEPFCRDCHRARLSADGRLYTCLFASLGWDVLGCLRSGADDPELARFIGRIWAGRMDRYSDERAEAPGGRRGPRQDRDELHRRIASFRLRRRGSSARWRPDSSSRRAWRDT